MASMSSKFTLAIFMCLTVAGWGCGGSSTATTPPTPDWTIIAVSPNVAPHRTTTNLGELFDAGTVSPGQTVSAIKFLALATNGYDQAVQMSDVSSGSASHVACLPSTGSVTPTSAGSPFSVSFTVPANYPYAGSGASFEGTDPAGNKKVVGITFKVQAVSGNASRGSFKSPDLADSVPIGVTPINGFTGQVGISFDRSFQSSDGVPSGYLQLPSAVSVSAQAVTISGSSAVNGSASFTWASWAAGNYAVIAVLTKGTMAIRVPVEITVTTGSSSGPVTYSAPVSTPSGNGARIQCVSPGGKMVGQAVSGAQQYWASPTSSPTTINTSGLGATAEPAAFAVNDSGQIAGNAARGPCYWASASTSPTYLKLPAGYNGGAALSINAAGNIVGQAVPSGNLSAAVGVYWSSGTATPVVLSSTIGGTAGTEFLAYGISNAGTIAGTGSPAAGSQRVLVWSSTAADPTALSPSTAENFLGMNQTTGAVSGRSGNTPYVWFPSSYAPTLYAGSGFINAIGSDGVGVGSDVNQATAMVWTSATAQPVALSTLTQAPAGWTLQQALFMTSAGDVIGTGQVGGNTGVFVVQRTH
jgi:hypothetical protein